MRLGPWLLAPNFAQPSYRGGGAVERFRGLEPGRDPSPEDWIASVTTRRDMSPLGLSVLPDGRRLTDAISEEPDAFFGPEHLAAFGPDPMLLVKLLESATRLLVHCHPDRDFARTHLGGSHGKTEAWFVLSAVPGGEVFLGFSEEVTREQLRSLVEEQRVEEMIALLNRVAVSEGDSILVPAGVPHAIGSGVLVLELQEPSDLSVLLETGDSDSPDLGMGWEIALGCVDCSGWSPSRLEHLKRTVEGVESRIFPPAADPFFRADLVLARPNRDARLDQSFTVIVVIDGRGELKGSFQGSPIALSRGATVLVPHSAGTVDLTGSLKVAVCRPPISGSEYSARPKV